MDIGDLGFLIIAFIVFVINFILKARKGKMTGARQPELPEPWEVKDILPPILKNPLDKEDKAEKKRTPRIIPSVQETLNNQHNFHIASNEGVSALSSSSLSSSLYKNDEMEVDSEHKHNHNHKSYISDLFHNNITEELKKGIIYSEILHRKYE